MAQEVKKDTALPSKEEHKRKQRVLTQGTPSITRSISDALVMKNENIFFLTLPDGDVPLSENHGYGLYYHDCRYLNGYHLDIAHAAPIVLVSSASSGFTSIVELTNPEIMVGDGVHIEEGSLGVKWERILDGKENALYDTLTINNYSLEAATFPLSLIFRSQFEDVFAIRGLLSLQLGKLLPPRWNENNLVFDYEGADEIYRSLIIHFVTPPDQTGQTSAEYSIHLNPREKQEIVIGFMVSESTQKLEHLQKYTQNVSARTILDDYERISHEWLKDQMTMDSQELLTKGILNRALLDLRTLRSSLDGDRYFAAGVPWFSTLFGRDSIISSLEMLAFNRNIAAETLRLLAKYQAKQVDTWRDAQPGKILHELRVGEMAHLHDIPHTPYYGSIDATLLFLILIARASAWVGNLDLFNELKPNIEAALNWIDQYGDTDGDGYVDYQSHTEHGLVNQGWKDSGNAIMNADGSFATPPVALPEVQGYVFRAKLGIANLFETSGDTARANQLRQQARDLQARFNRDFWSDQIGTYVLALQAEGKPAEVVASNAGQVLWSGIADPDKAKKTAQRLMADDMFNGWGIRTLSNQSSSYNPVGYHLGTVWPFDNAMIAAGFRRYGLDEQALSLFNAMMTAAMFFDNYRLPELFAGFSRADYQVPVHYPVACHPQAWSAGSIPYLLTTLLGLVPDGFARKLAIVRPRLPVSTGTIEVRNLIVGKASTDLLFTPSDEGAASVKVLRVEGQLDVSMDNSLREYDF